MAGDEKRLNIVIDADSSGAEAGIQKLNNTLNSLNNELNEIGNKSSNFGSEIEGEADKASDSLTKTGDAAEKANTQLSKVGQGLNLGSLSQQLDNISSKFQSWGQTLTLMAAPFEAIGAIGVKSFADFESSMSKVFTLLPDISQEAMSDMSRQMKEFASEYGADITEATQAAYDALSAGISQEDMFAFMGDAQKAGVAGMSNVSVAVDGLTSAMNAYQMDASKAGDVSDIFFKTVELGKIEFEELANNIGKVSPTASTLGVDLKDVGAGIAAITSLGVSAPETMTSLKALLKDLATPSSDLSKIFTELAGKSFKQFIAEGGNLAGAMQILNGYMQSTGQDAFSLTKNFEAANAVSMLTGDNMNRLAEFTDKVGNSMGSTNKAYETVSKTMSFQMQQLKAELQRMSIEIGEALAPTVKEFVGWLKENSDEIRDFAVSIAETAVPALETLFDILTGLMDAFNGLPPEARGLLAAALGVGIGGAALGGPLLMGAGMALGPLSTMVSLLGSLVVPATVATEIGAIGTAAGVAAGSGGVGALETAIAALGGGPVVLALAGVTLGIAAWETDFMGVRTTVLGAAQDAFNGFQEAVNQGINVASSGGASVGKSFYEGIQSLTGFDLSGMIAPLDAVISQAQERARTGGAEAAQAYIREWNDVVASGELKVPNVPGSETPSRSITMENNPVDIDWNEINRQKGYLENIDAYTKNLTFVGVGNLTATDANSLEYQQSIEKVNQSFSRLPGKIQEAVQQGAKDGITDASSQPQPDAVTGKTSGFDEFKAYKNSGLSDREKYTDESLHKLYDTNSNLITKYEALAASKAEEAEATKSGTAAKSKYTNQGTVSNPTVVTLSDISTSQLTDKKWYSGMDTEQAAAYISSLPADQRAAAESEWANRWNTATTATTQQQTAATKSQTESVKEQTKAVDAQKKASDKLAEKLSELKTMYDYDMRNASTQKERDSLTEKYNRDVYKAKVTSGVDAATVQTVNDGLNKVNTALANNGNITNSLATSYDKANVISQNLGKNAGSAFKELQDRQETLTRAYKSGAITQQQYIEGEKALSREYDITLRNLASGQKEWSKVEKETSENWQRRVENITNHYNAGLMTADEYIAKLQEIADTWLGAGDAMIQKTEEVKKAAEDNKNYVESKAVDDLAKQKSLTEGVFTGYGEDFYRKAIDDQMKKTADEVRSYWGDDFGSKQSMQDMEQKLERAMKYYPGNTRGGARLADYEITEMAKPYVDRYTSDEYIRSAEQAQTATDGVSKIWKRLSDQLDTSGANAEQAATIQARFNDLTKDNNASLADAQDFLNTYNMAMQDTTQYTQDQTSKAQHLMQALIDGQNAQMLYNTAMQDGVIDATEAAAINGQLSTANQQLAEAGITAQGGISGLPAALQNLGSYAQSIAEQINAAIGAANAAVASAQQYLTSVQTASQYKPDTNYKSSMANKYNITVTGNTFGSTTTAGKVVSDILNSSRASGF